MTIQYQRLAAAFPASSAEASLYIVPASTYVVGTLTVCNQDNSARQFSVAVCDTSGASAASEDWVEYYRSIAGKVSMPVGPICIEADSEIRVKAVTASSVSFVFMGMKVT